MIAKTLTLIRYRFLLFAGLLPYCLGAAVVYSEKGSINATLFILGLTGLFFALIGVETFNEYFDWKHGTDRVFELNSAPTTRKTLYIGIFSFAVAFLFALLLASKAGLGILIFAFIGFIAAAGYLGPPIRFTYRGLGELVIALSYGPFMVLGSYYLQTGTISLKLLLISAIPAILLFNIAIINEVPDFLQDRLVGKQNLCVRLGRKKTVKLHGLFSLLLLFVFITGVITGIIPKKTLFGLLILPFAHKSYRIACNCYENPSFFLTVIRSNIIIYVFTIMIFILGFLI